MKTRNAGLIAIALLVVPPAKSAEGGSIGVSATVLPSAVALAGQAHVVAIDEDGQRHPLSLTAAQKVSLLLWKGNELLRVRASLAAQGIQVIEVTY